jgi:hypothetical protein
VLRNSDEDAGRESHVEDAVGLLAALLEALEVVAELNERLVLVVLSRDVRAEATELLKLLLHILCGGLDVGLDPLQVLVVVHLRARISNDANVLREEVVSVLHLR